MGILIYQIPFIHKQDQSFPLFNDIIQNGFVLFAEPFFPINQHQRHITKFNGSLGPKTAVEFNTITDLTPLSQSCSIHQGNFIPVIF